MIIHPYGKKDSGIEKCLKFLSNLEIKLNSLESEIIIEPKNIIGKTCFYESNTGNYKLYDFEKFNSLLSTEYNKSYLNKILEKSFFYKKMLKCLNSFLNEVDSKRFMNLFFRTLRLSRLKKNLFDLKKIKQEFPSGYLNYHTDYKIDHIKILDIYLNILVEEKICVFKENFLLKFHKNSSLEELVNLSFDTPELGSKDGFLVVTPKYDIAVCC